MVQVTSKRPWTPPREKQESACHALPVAVQAGVLLRQCQFLGVSQPSPLTPTGREQCVTYLSTEFLSIVVWWLYLVSLVLLERCLPACAHWSHAYAPLPPTSLLSGEVPLPQDTAQASLLW